MNLSRINFSARGFVLLFLSLCFGSLLCLIIISELFLRFIVVPTDNFYKHLDFYEKVEAADVVAFGDSRMSQSFMPKRDGIVNLGYASESFEQIVQKIDYFLENKTTEKILLQVSPHMFAQYRFDGDRRDYDVFFAPEAKWKKQLYLQDPVLRGQLLDYWQLFFMAGGKIPNQSVFSRTNGSVVIDLTMEYPPTSTQKEYFKVRLKEHALSEDYKDRETWDVMRNTIRKIKDEDIELCLVSFPVTPFYSEPALQAPHMKDAIENLKTLARKESVPYFFHWDFYGDRYELFRNLDHLNIKGAELFTGQILNDCGF